MIHKFKLGDRVELIDPPIDWEVSSNCKLGRVYEVCQLNAFTDEMRIAGLTLVNNLSGMKHDGESWWIQEDHFKLAHDIPETEEEALQTIGIRYGYSKLPF